MTSRIVMTCLVGCAAWLAACLASLSVGSVAISPSELVQALQTPHGTDLAHQVVWQLRLPRILLAGSVGASLALAGVAFQSLLRNPLADPYIVGTSAGAALGAACSLVLGLGSLAVPLAAFLGAVGAMAAVYRLSRRDGYLPVETFLLAGVVVSAFLGSLVSLILSLAREDLPRIVLWLMGTLANARWEQLGMTVPYLALGGGTLFALALSLNLLTLGEDSARSLGLEVERLKLIVVALGSLLTASAVSVAGLIGFVGLVVPHLARKLVGSDHRLLLPASGWLGASFLILADTLARTLRPGSELPVGVVTALVGAPFFLGLMRRR